MNTLTLTDWASIAQITMVVVTTVGIFVTLFIAVSTIREVKRDRALRHRPYLVFDQGGHDFPIEFVAAGKSIPGVNPAYVAKMFPNLPVDARSVRLISRANDFGVGRLTNYGVGPALLTETIWVPRQVQIGAEKFELDARKLCEPVYSRALNKMPSYKAHVSPGTATCLTRLPTFIEKDIDRKITTVEGFLEITCLDIFHNRITTKQEFWIRTAYAQPRPEVHITFGHLLDEDNNRTLAST